MPDSTPVSPENQSLAHAAGAASDDGGAQGTEKSSSPLQERKIKRIQLSCTSCRHRKLKCNRLQPCENCVKRGQANSCYYANPGPKKTPAQARLSARNNELQQRLMHLEELVVSLQSRNESGGGSPEAIAAAIEARGSRREPPAASSIMDGDSEHPGRMVTDRSGTRYVDAAHWQSMLDEITQVKEYVGANNDEVDDDVDLRNVQNGPPLLLGSIAAATMSDLLGGIPSRPIVDQLVTRWFRGKEPGLITIHIPTFLDEYDRFWKDPRSSSPAYLAMLYSIIWLGAMFFMRTGEKVPSDRPADPDSLMDFYLTKAAQGLILSDYTRPGKHKLQAMCLYFIAEYNRYRDAQVGMSFLISIIVRTAMVTGYHRDPKHFPSLTPFEGEIRRRVWVLILQLDTLVAFQVGLPRTIHDWQCDTSQPRNLHDEDLHVDMEKLPPSRPESERTPVTYQIGKGRVMSVFGTISDRAYSRERMTYDEIMLLDMRLREAYDSLPSFLKPRPLELAIADAPETVIQRYNLLFLYHKGRCILHRRCFSGALSDARCLYSKRICVESATEILRKQKEIHDATHTNGVLKHEAWYLSSLTTHDFIMAAMVLCLWLSREQNNTNAAQSDALEALRAQPNAEEMFKILEDSYKVWLHLKEKSYEAFKASRALAVILGKARARTEKPAPTLSDRLTKDFSSRMAVNQTATSASTGPSTKGTNKSTVGKSSSTTPTQLATNAAAMAQGRPSPFVGREMATAGMGSETLASGASVSSSRTVSTADGGSQNSGSPPENDEGTPPSDANGEDGIEWDMETFDDSTFATLSEEMMDAPLDLDWSSWDMQYIRGKEQNPNDLGVIEDMDWLGGAANGAGFAQQLQQNPGFGGGGGQQQQQQQQGFGNMGPTMQFRGGFPYGVSAHGADASASLFPLSDASNTGGGGSGSGFAG